MRESIENPQAKIVTGFGPIMPTFQGQVTPEQLMQLMAFIKSLQVTGAAACRAERRVRQPVPSPAPASNAPVQ